MRQQSRGLSPTTPTVLGGCARRGPHRRHLRLLPTRKTRDCTLGETSGAQITDFSKKVITKVIHRKMPGFFYLFR